MEALARELWDFAVDYDPYEAMDNDADNPETFDEFLRDLWKPEVRKGITAYLRDIVEYDDYEDNAEIAASLLRKMKEVFH